MFSKRSAVPSALVLAIGLGMSITRAQTDTLPGPLTPDDIAALRERGKTEGWTFTVAESEATRRPLHELCGAVEPPDWRSNAVFDVHPVRRDLPAAWDWRDYDGCSPIRAQGNCGSCWAFGAVGAVESAIRLNVARVGVCGGGAAPGDPCVRDVDCPPDGICNLPDVNLSEQWLISCTDAGNCEEGGWHTTALEYMRIDGELDFCGLSGAVPEANFPYAAADLACIACPYVSPRPYAISSWAVVGSEHSTATVSQIKQAIFDHGPVTASVHVNDAFHAYEDGVFNACVDGEINHSIVLAGWDDSLGTEGVWILRNSWGSDWGMDGYMLIEYGCSRVGYATCFVEYSTNDCNANRIPDCCDLDCQHEYGPCNVPGCGQSPDCNDNDIPDECDPDCNDNDLVDECEVRDGLADDSDGNLVPDECDPDFDGDGQIDGSDTDIDNDGVENGADICDYTPLGMRIMANGAPFGDIDQSCVIDIIDFGNVNTGFYPCMSRSGPGTYVNIRCTMSYDFDDDTDVDLKDFAAFQNAFGRE